MKKFEWVDHPSDIGFRAYGKTLEEAFGNAGLAMFEVMVDTKKVRPREEVAVELEAEDEKALLYDWLAHLLYLHGSRDMVFSKFEVGEISEVDGGFMLRATVRGEQFDPERHETRTEIKAVTYHLMEIERSAERCSVQTIVDI